MLFLLTGLGSPGLFAQQKATKTVQGSVFDRTGEPLAGAAVYTADKKFGAAADPDGHFTVIGVPSDAVLIVEFMGFVSQRINVADYKEGRDLRIFLEEDKSNTLDEVVVTGIFTRKKDSFTGAVQSMSSEDIKRVSNSNVVQALKYLDPSLLVLENLTDGSNPNSLASMQLRGASTLASEMTTGLKSDFINPANTPLFILDGFETTLEKITDMDMNRVQSITILKDASAKAIYGSKGANGVIVIETKALNSNKTLITYTGNMTIEAPDLTSYNLCNALEKLAVEFREGFYSPGVWGTVGSTAYESYALETAGNLYSERLKKALEGESTYWLSKPVRLGIGHKHSLSVEMGTKEIKALATISYNDVQGVMKGSYRDVLSGDVNLSYRHSKWIFRNIMSVSAMKSEDSPWGSFDRYAAMNPYFSPYDAEGNVVKMVSPKTYGSGIAAFAPYDDADIVNPMYNAQIGTFYKQQYLNFTENFYTELYLTKELKIVGRVGVDTQRTASDDFKPADHTDFYTTSNTTEDDRLARGSYDVSNGSRLTFSADISADFNKTFQEKHSVFSAVQWNLSSTEYSEVQHYTSGFPNSNMKNISFARQYTADTTPTGYEGRNRNLGGLLTGGYTYDNRYMVDATLKASASSVFGTKRHWGLFWSAGLAWNLHNEAFLKNASWIRQFKLRASLGSSGNQNFMSNVSLPVYSYYSSNYYNGFSGARLDNMENVNLGWEEKMDYNIGVDFRTRRLNAVLDFYIADTRNLVFPRSIVPSSGFTVVNENMGKVRNRGVEASLSYTLYQKGASFFSIFGKIAVNDNRVIEISEALANYNAMQQAVAESTHSEAPVVQYYNGVPLHSIWAVRSLGINSLDGKEIFLNRNGDMTSEWSAKDLVNCGSSDPLLNGNFGFSGEIHGIGMNFVATFYGGGYIYNNTLLQKVEGTNLSDNVDRRVFEGRWAKPGDVAPYKRNISAGSYTQATTRFVQKNNVLNLSSLSVYYEFPYALVSRLKMSRMRLTFYANDLYKFSSIEVERGTSYPYARNFSLSLTATF